MDWGNFLARFLGFVAGGWLLRSLGIEEREIHFYSVAAKLYILQNLIIAQPGSKCVLSHEEEIVILMMGGDDTYYDTYTYYYSTISPVEY